MKRNFFPTEILKEKDSTNRGVEVRQPCHQSIRAHQIHVNPSKSVFNPCRIKWLKVSAWMEQDETWIFRIARAMKGIISQSPQRVDRIALTTTLHSPRARRHILTFLLFHLLTFLPVLAEDKKQTPPLIPTAIVPYDHAQPLTKQQPERYYLDYETFQRMWEDVKAHRDENSKKGGAVAGTPDDHTLSSALYRIAMGEDRIAVSGRLALTTRGKDWQHVPLPFSGINLETIAINGSPASFRDGAILVEKAGQHLIEVEYEVPVGESTNDFVTWKIPPAAASLLQITMDSNSAEPVLAGNWPLHKSWTGDGPSLYTTAFGFGTHVEMRRRLKSTGRGMIRPNLVEVDARLFVSEGLEKLEATYRIGFDGQESDRFTIGFDSSLKPVQFDIPNLAYWEIDDGGANGQRNLAFVLTQPVKDSLEIGLVAERLASDSARNFPRLSADATRIVQQRALLRVNDFSIKAQPGPNHRQITFPGKAGQYDGFIPVSAFSLTGENEPLLYNAQTEAPERSAEASFVYQVGAGKLETIARFSIHSPDAPLVSNSFSIPTEASVQLVEGNRIKDWWRTGDELFVRYSGGTPETTSVLIYLTRQLDAEANSELAIEAIRIADFDDDKVTGQGLIVGHVTKDVSLALTSSGLVAREVGIAEVAQDFEVIAPLERKRGFRFSRSDYSGSITLTDVDPKYNGLWVMLARIHESYAQISLQADIEVTQSGLNRIAFRTPESFPELRVISNEVRELTHELIDGVRHYEIVFQQYITDAVSFTLETEIPHGGDLSLPDLAFTGAARQERFVIVENRSPERMTTSTSGLEKTVESLLPYKPGGILRSAALFRAQPKWSLSANLEQLQTSGGNDAVILYADLTTSIRANGEEWLKAVYHIQNRSLQFLSILPPDGTELMSVVVDGEEVRSDSGEVNGQPGLLVPLIQTKLGQLAYDVELVFRSQRSRTGGAQMLNHIDRRLDDPLVVGPTVEKTFWRVYLPANHELGDADGNMNQVERGRRILAMLQCDIDELKFLNTVAADFDNGIATRNTSLENGDLLVQRIEDNLSRIGGQLQGGENAELRKVQQELEQQKVVITENRIELPNFQGGNVAIDADGDIKVDRFGWFDNSDAITKRNQELSEKKKKQISQVESQVRLNDNISIGGGFQGNHVSAKEPAAKGNDSYSQIGVLNRGSIKGDVGGKLSLLNRAQVDVQDVEDKIPFIGDLPQQTETGVPLTNARSKIAGKQVEPTTAKPATANQAIDINAIDALIADATSIEAESVVAKGRRSVRVDFPVEGQALYFEKLKDHAEIFIASARPRDMNRWLWLGVFLVLGLALWSGDRWLARRKAA